MTNSNPIGLFDSGVGGTSIWNEIYSLLPNEEYIYLADSKNAPYGEKSKEEIIFLSSKNTELLLNLNCKLIVVACNTATTNAIKELRIKYKVPFVGIEPAIKPAALHSQTQKIGILATKGTLNSELFYKNIEKFQDILILEQIGYGLVELIENGNMKSPEMTSLLEKYLNPMIDANIDYLVLGCSHYPYLIPQIKKLLPSHIKIIDSGQAVAKQTKLLLTTTVGLHDSSNTNRPLFYTNSNPEVLSNILNSKFKVHFLNF